MHENIANEVQELAARCKQACQSYTRVSAELAALMDEQYTIVEQHEDLLVRASFELRVSCLPGQLHVPAFLPPFYPPCTPAQLLKE